MKKAIYYLSPMGAILIIFSLVTILENFEVSSSLVPFFTIAALLLFSATIGLFSPAKTLFDYIITATVPASVFLSLFVGLIFDRGCDGTPQLSLSHATNPGYYLAWLPMALIMAAITFAFSFKPLRGLVKRFFNIRCKS